MDPQDLKKLITKKTKAIIPVHMLGVPARMNEIIKIAKKKISKFLKIIVRLSAQNTEKILGTIGDVGVLSFDYAKMITTGGEGGLVLTNNRKFHKICKEYHDHGHENNPKVSRGNDTKTIYGFNYRMTEIQATIGKEQIKKLNFILQDNKKKYLKLEKTLKNFMKLEIYHLFLILLTIVLFLRFQKKSKGKK